MAQMNVLTLLRLQEFNDFLKQRYTTRSQFTQLSNEVTAVKGVLDVLQGSNEGSIQKAVADAIAKVVDNAPENLNTLKELADWINQHQSTATEMNSAITDNKNAINELKTLVGVLPDEAVGETIVAYIQEQVATCIKTTDMVEITSEEIQAMFDTPD